VQEDIHTRTLLFPDAQALYQHRHDQVFPLTNASALPSTSTASAFDFDGDIDLDTRDIRVIIMQDTLGSVNASLLFDSHQPATAPQSPPDRPTPNSANFQDSRRTPTSPRKSSLSQSSRPLVIQSESPQPRQGAFDRRASMQGRSQSYVETEMQRTLREYREELATFSSCIFGNSELMAYKGTSTKVHVVPSESRSTEYSSSYVGDGRGSIGRSSMRSSRLAQSYSSETVSPIHAPPSYNASSSTASRQLDRKKVLITRLFPVILTTDDGDGTTHQQATPTSRLSEETPGFPFPPSGDDSVPKKKKPQPKQKRTPMYAVVLVIQLPSPGAQFAPVLSSKSTFRGPSSYTDQESFPSSFNSARRQGWTMIGAGAQNDTLDPLYTNDIEDRIDSLTQHWDIIMRTLTHLQSVVATTLSTMLRKSDISSPDPYPISVSSYLARTPSLSNRRGEDVQPNKPPKSNAKLVTLLPNALSEDRHISREVEVARSRIVMGLRAARVVTGQGRWGIWRDEARWVAKWAGNTDQGSFFFNLLTGFLATHTDWLQALSPPLYRKRYQQQQQRMKGEEDMSLPARTVIVGHDKMAARRLVFLLSAFLPANQQLPTARTHRPSTSASAFSQSPPSYVVPILREESLRRKINRRTGPRQVSHSRNVSQSTRGSGVPVQLAHLSMEGHHERRISDAASIRTTNLPIPGSDLVSRKSSAATTTTITAETSVPHFSTIHRTESHQSTRPGSSGSVAAEDLKRSLKRGESTGHASMASTDSRGNGSRWGVITGLWSAKRRESTGVTDHTRPSTSSRGSIPSNPASPAKVRSGNVDKLAEMVREVSVTEGYNRASPEEMRQMKVNNGLETPRGFLEFQQEGSTSDQPLAMNRTPDPAGAFESPVKTSINLDDGVIDVDVPFPDYLTSFETAVSSPSSSGYLSTPGFGIGLDGFEQSSMIGPEADLPLNVTGWLQRYHPDFSLQAIPPQEALLEEVKASLRAEPSPPLNASHVTDQPDDRWVEISSAIIADTTNFTIRRIRYRRQVRPKPSVELPNLIPSVAASLYGTALLTPSIMPYEQQLREEFIEEPLEKIDELLIDAVEKVIAQNQDASKGSSSSSSRSNSKRRERSNSESTQPDDAQYIPHEPPPPILREVPRGECKTVVLSALSDIIREVVETLPIETQDGVDDRIDGEKEGPLRKAIRSWLKIVANDCGNE
jgi:hypothetical protein